MRIVSIVLIIILSAIPSRVVAEESDCETGCASCVPQQIEVCIGVGPAPKIMPFYHTNFDKAYILAMYQQNADIAGLASLGARRALDRCIRVLSTKIVMERLESNQDLELWYRQYFNCQMPEMCTGRLAALEAQLACYSDSGFDCIYASMIIGLMQQAKDAATIAVDRTGMLLLNRQARITCRTNENEIRAFYRWRETGQLPPQR